MLRWLCAFCFLCNAFLPVTAQTDSISARTGIPSVVTPVTDSTKASKETLSGKIGLGKLMLDTLSTKAPIAVADTLKTDTTASTKKAKKHSPLKAALFSMALPGLGQAYNKKYWKIPIVYAGLGGLGYAVYYTATNFNQARAAYRLQADENPLTIGSYRGETDAFTLKSYRDYYKRYLDISAICLSVWYVLNIVDATVDAHLFNWNVKDDLTVSWHPTLVTNTYSPQATAGATIRLHF